MSLGLILVIVLIVVLVGGNGPWVDGPGYGVGHGLNGALGLILVIILILFVLGRI